MQITSSIAALPAWLSAWCSGYYTQLVTGEKKNKNYILIAISFSLPYQPSVSVPETCPRPLLWFLLCGKYNITKKETLRTINLTRAWAILWYWNQHWVSKIAAQCNKVYKICLVDIFSLLQRWIHSSGWKHKSKNCTTLFCHQRKTIPLPHNLNTNPPTTASHPCPWQQMFSNQEMTL